MNTAGKDCMHFTRYPYLDPSAQSQGLPQPPLELPIPGGAELIPLPAPDQIHIPPADLRTIIEQRRSLRRYKPEPLELDELAYLLWSTQGVRRVTETKATFRNVPSAGARHALETFLLINRVTGLEAGLYRYAALGHQLALLKKDGELASVLARACLEQAHVRASAVTFVWAAVVERMAWRYGQRGYRYLHLDAGHTCQNLYLAAEQIDCGVCAIAAFDDDLINAALDLDGESVFTIYAASLGKR